MDNLARILLWTILVILMLWVPRWTSTHKNVHDLNRLRSDLQDLQYEVRDLKMQNSRLVDRIVAVGKSPEARATRAIVDYNLLGPRDIVLRFNEED